MHSGSSPTSQWPGVSVVIPTRDRPELLRRAVRRVLDQDYPGEVECLVVFDQSEPTEVPEPLPPRRCLRTFGNRRTPGLAGARNTGALAAGGELVAFCDDDDEWLAGKLAAQVELLRAHPGNPVAACGIQVHYGDRVIERVPPPGPVPLHRFLRSRVMEVHPSTILVRRQALLGAIGLVDEQLPGSYYEDYEWLLRAARVAPVQVVPRALVRVHWHPTSFFSGRWRTIAEAISYLIDKHPELRSDPAGMARLEGQAAFAHAALGERGAARSWAGRALRHNWRERRGYVALAVSARLLRAETVMRLANSMGRGV
ncbi:MAG TPA: glycosyltransferase family 2 protein [Actinomycetes bacterium]|nr:glycosyltransferase family 2 protein [Actinomycetes bacterium]